jgi:hypothetical protein
MRILILNQDWFAAELRTMGHEVVTCGIAAHLDHQIEVPLIHLDEIIKKLPGTFNPDRILILDNSAPIVVDGLSDTQIPVLFYSVDAHHHARLHAYLSHVFDETLIAQKDYIPEFEKRGASAEWLPLWASQVLDPSNEKTYGAVFVGTLNPDLNPDRVAFFEALKTQAPVQVQQGNFPTIFPRSRLILNQTVKGDVNFRVFEAMSSGTPLLTERSGNGLFELFTEGQEFLCYARSNVQEAAEKIHWALEHPIEMREIGAAGRAEILRAHRPIDRALVIEQKLQRLEKRSSPLKHFSWMANFHALTQRLEKIDTSLCAQAMVRTLRAAELALQAGGTINQELSLNLVQACAKHDLQYRSKSGKLLLDRTSEMIPDEKVLVLARVRDALNDGRRDDAKQLASRIIPENPEAVFPHAESLTAGLLEPSGDN